MNNRYVKAHTTSCEAPLKVTPGYFTTNCAHVNYYINMTILGTKFSGTQEIAKSLIRMFPHDMVVNTIACLERVQVIGSFLTQELVGAGVLSMNVHRTIYIVTPGYNSNSQMILKEDILPTIWDKNVILLTTSVATGFALNKRTESVLYYREVLREITVMFGTLSEINGHKVTSIFSKRDVPEYAFYGYRDRPFCKQGRELEAPANSHGYTSL